MQDALSSLFSAEVQRWAITWELNKISTFWCPCFEKWKIAYVKSSRRFDHIISKGHFLLIVCQYWCPVWKGLGLWGWYEILTKKSSWLKCVEMFWEFWHQHIGGNVEVWVLSYCLEVFEVWGSQGMLETLEVYRCSCFSFSFGFQVLQCYMQMQNLLIDRCTVL